jgi:hypothetical protein
VQQQLLLLLGELPHGVEVDAELVGMTDSSSR